MGNIGVIVLVVISTFVVFNSVTVCFCLIMKVFGLLFLLGSAYCGVPSCTTVWENKRWDEPRQQCNTVQVPNKVTTYEQKCTTEYEQKCNTVMILRWNTNLEKSVAL